jgi:uncharacterized protein (DUF1015 family)
MARIYPFRALRYDTSQVDMQDVVTQPYDKITPAMQQRYYDASPYNLVRVILGKPEPGDDEETNVYTRAAEYLKSWRRQNILREESEPALYGYSQTYTVPHTDEVRERRGFIALGHLYDYADKVVYRHELTHAKAKSDRMSLFKATRTYCEQIYMLYSDPAFTAEKLIFGTGGGEGTDGGTADLAIPDLAIQDEYNVVHRLWKLTDPALINLILTAMADKKLIIADGHHRYETSVAYARERSAQLRLPLNQPRDEDEKISPGHLPTPPFPEAAMMMTFVNMDAPGITILPTHRVLFGLHGPDGAAFSTQAFLDRAAEFFTIKPLPMQQPESNLEDRAAKLTAELASLQHVAFVAVTHDGAHLLTAKPEAVAQALAGLSPRQAQLDVVQLHSLLIEKILGLTPESIRQGEHLRYLREAGEAVAEVTSGAADIAFLIRPVTLDQLHDISLSGDVMPQKSTDFYPKLLSGLAIYALD